MTASGAARLCAEQNFVRSAALGCIKVPSGASKSEIPDKTLENHRTHRSPKVLIPPRKGAQLALDSAGTRQRNRNIRARSRVGKRKWYVASGYSRRSKVETTFHRYKAILGSAMRARGLASQRVEVRLGCKILNLRFPAPSTCSPACGWHSPRRAARARRRSPAWRTPHRRETPRAYPPPAAVQSPVRGGRPSRRRYARCLAAAWRPRSRRAQ